MRRWTGWDRTPFLSHLFLRNETISGSIMSVAAHDDVDHQLLEPFAFRFTGKLHAVNLANIFRETKKEQWIRKLKVLHVTDMTLLCRHHSMELSSSSSSSEGIADQDMIMMTIVINDMAHNNHDDCHEYHGCHLFFLYGIAAVPKSRRRITADKRDLIMALDLAAALSNTRFCPRSTNMLYTTKRTMDVTASTIVVVKVYVKASPMWNDSSYSAVV
jgi:hypothetical protein